METLTLQTSQRNQMINITPQIIQTIRKSGVKEGQALVHIPHTTAGITINENADPDVAHDILLTLEELIPHLRRGYRHNEGNSDAHVKASLMGHSASVIIHEGLPVMGTWQGIYFCEFDGPRTRQYMVQINGQ